MAKPGKWSHLKGKYDKLPLESDYMQKLDVILDSPPSPIMEECIALGATRIRNLTDVQLKDRYLKARQKVDELTNELATYALEVEAYTRLFIKRFDDNDTQSVNFDDGVQLGASFEPYPNVKDKDALMTWVKSKGLEVLLSLNYQTLASLVKERLEGKVNEPIPDGVDIFLKEKLTCRGRK